MTENKPQLSKEILVSEQVLRVPFCYSAGKVTSRFLLALRDEATLYGIRCPLCRKVYAPPRAICGSCFTDTEEWVPLSGEGIVESYTEVRYAESVHPCKPPFTIGLIRLHGADTGMVHIIREVEGNRITIGQRVRVVFTQERKGH